MRKRPIPIDLKQRFGKLKSAYAVYLQLLLDAVDQPTLVGWVSLQRGQVLYWRWKYDGYLPIKGSSVDASCLLLSKRLSLIELKAGNKYTIITLVWYDDLVTMDQPNWQQADSKQTKIKLPTGTVKERRKKKEDKSIGHEPIPPEEWFEIFKEKITEKKEPLLVIANKYGKDFEQEVEKCRRRHQKEKRQIKDAYATVRNRLLPKKREWDVKSPHDVMNSLFRECGWDKALEYTNTLTPDGKKNLYEYLLKKQKTVWITGINPDRLKSIYAYITSK